MTANTVRVGDPERERTATLLGKAFAQGYLTMGEYESRLGPAFAAQSFGALNHLTADLPVRRISRQDPRRRAARGAAARRGVQIHLAAYLAVSVLMVGIWVATAVASGAWYFWPVWPILGWAIGVASHATSVHASGRKRRHPAW